MSASPGKRIIQVAVPRPLHSVYEYAVPEDQPLPQPGARVSVPFGRSRVIGITVGNPAEPSHPKPKDVLAVLDDAPLVGEELLDLARWMRRYYHHPLGEVLATVLPAAARKGAEQAIKPEDNWQVTDLAFTNSRAKKQAALHELIAASPGIPGAEITAAGFSRAILRALTASGHVTLAEQIHASDRIVPSPHEPNDEQRQAIAAITDKFAEYHTFLLHGITGSGKTEVYLKCIERTLRQKKQALVLVPEIGLTPQTLARFQARFPRTGMLHSNLTDRERFQTWLKCRSGELDVLIGTRSAVFASFPNLGLIVVDEEHDASYKQQDGLRYSARDIAAKRAHTLHIPLVLGSATPSLESLYNVQQKRYSHLCLTERAGGAKLPSYHLIDMRGQSHEQGISIPLQHVMRRHIEAKGQILVYLNRRGYAPTLLCAACGWQAQCSDCDARTTLHRKPGRLICHHCSLRFPIPERCEQCGQASLMPIGLGTQRSEEALQRLFPDLPIHRIDRDTTRSTQALVKKFDAINAGDPCIMVGTQMLAKGHHFPAVTLVAILNADAGFLSPDFRAPERTAQLIVQVAGRAGRAERPGEVWIQSYQPESPALARLIKEGYSGFAEHALAERITAGFPPAKPMAMIRAESPNPAEAQGFLRQLKQQLNTIMALGPVAAPLARLANRSRFQLMLIGQSRSQLHNALDQLTPPETNRNLRWSVDIDPYDGM